MTDPVGVLRGREERGVASRVLSHGDGVVVDLLISDGGEEVDRLTPADPELVAFLGDRTGSAGTS